ncbi:MAG: hypothetical protein AAB250_08000, partial [Bdellovibrionota bacterium]
MSPSLSTLVPIAVSSAILVAGVVDDLRSRKFHNWLFLTCAAIAVIAVVVMNGPAGMLMGLLGFAAGFALLTP